MVTLRFSLLFIFISLFVTMMLVLFSVFYFHVSRLLLQAGLILMEKESHTIIHELELQLQPAVSASQLSASSIREGILDIKNEKEIMVYLIHLLKRLPLVQAVYWGDNQGDFIYARKENNGTYMTAVINRHIKIPTSTYFYWDRNHREIKQQSVPLDFDPRTRPWFSLAVQQKRTVWTDVYVYEFKPLKLGITVATPVFYNNEPRGVFGVDIRLDELAHYISKQEASGHADIMILDKTGRVIVPPRLIESTLLPAEARQLSSVRNISKPWVEQAFDEYLRTSQSFFLFENKGIKYLASFNPIPILKENAWIVGIVDEEYDFTREIHKVELMYSIIDLVVFVVGILLILHLVSRIVAPIKKLVSETEKIKNFELEGSTRVTSHIKEIIEIANAIYSMKSGLRSFKKYVPASLVRQLIKEGEDVRIGGKKEELAIFFSDIKDFTTISEKTDPNLLTKQVCDYFDAFSHIISKENGTIDKYIGDSIMAFWGAPTAIKHPCEHAAYAALHCMQQLTLLNQQWLTANKPGFYTRIGLHYGMAIVGNLGSSERLNYTVLGDAVNIASRLVNANKIYGTSILVSEAVYMQINHNFTLRMVDQVTLKGKAESITIYELLGEKGQQLEFDVEDYDQKFTQAFNAYQQKYWQQAIVLFEQCLQIYPTDTVVQVFIARCKEFSVHPPSKEWNGIWHLSDK